MPLLLWLLLPEIIIATLTWICVVLIYFANSILNITKLIHSHVEEICYCFQLLNMIFFVFF